MNTKNESRATFFAATATVALLSLGGAGCSNSASNSPAPLTDNTTIVVPTHRATTGSVSSAEVSATSDTNAGPGGATGTEDTIAGRIDAAIIHNTQMTGSRIAAIVDSSGAATLNGTVQNAQQKALAEKAAHDTPGVLSLKDKLEIRPTGGAGIAKNTAQVLTALPIGTDVTAPASDTVQTASSTAVQPRVMVVNSYVPVPQQSDNQDGNQPTINVLVSPSNNNGYGNYGGYGANSDAYSAYNSAGYDAGSADYGSANGNGNAYYDDGSGSNAARLYTGRPGIVRSNLIPGYLRNMSDANDYRNFLVNGGGY